MSQLRFRGPLKVTAFSHCAAGRSEFEKRSHRPQLRQTGARRPDCSPGNTAVTSRGIVGERNFLCLHGQFSGVSQIRSLRSLIKDAITRLGEETPRFAPP
ncbi:hypothetical protein SKAU_G00111240 [Synaphobranchus kaupii]|uniref:Uncharacterized protein n=1 Tax=Synaphobranchus kaupii TaxID=118154 RepID=A0A9Q1G0J9_SYNKA|nr:hypothetical protein SKAU_G00111240 [Synaphobranchus kaupii]